MDDSNVCLVVPETEIMALKEALCDQQQLLQKLYTELDEERESSATAASEALSMILRLQGEKAAVEMEASQYKRMVEEKMSHAEDSLAIYEDIIYQKEMEIASLEFQIQAYRCKLLSLGCSDLGVGESRFPERFLLQRNNDFLGEMGDSSNLRRLKSLPPIRLTDSYCKKKGTERETSISKVIEEVDDYNLDLEKNSEYSAGVDSNSYWDQIRRLDERVKEISGSKIANKNTHKRSKGELRSHSLISQVSTSTSFDPRGGKIAPSAREKQSEESSTDSNFSSSVHDIYEVPEIDEELRHSKLILEAEDRLGKPDLVLEENFESHVEYETDKLKKVLPNANYEKRLSKLIDGINVDCKVAIVRDIIGVSECRQEFQQLSERVERLEGERNETQHEIGEEREREELNLLKEILEQLNSIRSEMKGLRAKKSRIADEPDLLPLQEAMLHFWL